MTALDFRNLLTRMHSGTHRQFNVNGHRVRVLCNKVGDRSLLIEGVRYSLNSSTFDADVNTKLWST